MWAVLGIAFFLLFCSVCTSQPIVSGIRLISQAENEPSRLRKMYRVAFKKGTNEDLIWKWLCIDRRESNALGVCQVTKPLFITFFHPKFRSVVLCALCLKYLTGRLLLWFVAQLYCTTFSCHNNIYNWRRLAINNSYFYFALIVFSGIINLPKTDTVFKPLSFKILESSNPRA